MLDFKAAFRALRKTPAFTIGAILTLAVALGLVTTTLGLLAGALARGPPSGRPVVLYLTETQQGRTFRMRWPYPAVEMLRSDARSFARIATYTGLQLNADVGQEASRLQGEFVSPEYFEIVGVAPALGRVPATHGT